MRNKKKQQLVKDLVKVRVEKRKQLAAAQRRSIQQAPDQKILMPVVVLDPERVLPLSKVAAARAESRGENRPRMQVNQLSNSLFRQKLMNQNEHELAPIQKNDLSTSDQDKTVDSLLRCIDQSGNTISEGQIQQEFKENDSGIRNQSKTNASRVSENTDYEKDKSL